MEKSEGGTAKHTGRFVKNMKHGTGISVREDGLSIAGMWAAGRLERQHMGAVSRGIEMKNDT